MEYIAIWLVTGFVIGLYATRYTAHKSSIIGYAAYTAFGPISAVVAIGCVLEASTAYNIPFIKCAFSPFTIVDVRKQQEQDWNKIAEDKRQKADDLTWTLHAEVKTHDGDIRYINKEFKGYCMYEYYCDPNSWRPTVESREKGIDMVLSHIKDRGGVLIDKNFYPYASINYIRFL